MKLESSYGESGLVEYRLVEPVGVHPSIAAVLRFFAYSHLPPALQEVSRPFAELAMQLVARAQNAETTVALRKLLEAKDAAVRASLPETIG